MMTFGYNPGASTREVVCATCHQVFRTAQFEAWYCSRACWFATLAKEPQEQWDLLLDLNEITQEEYDERTSWEH